jgi:regulator of sirC expression with transglutaminase-like and TPR domain
MEALRAALLDAPEARLDVAALEIACIETPDLDAEPFLAILDRMASAIASRLPSGVSGREFVLAANRYLFDELGFHGNEMDYNDPRNSCLNYVLDRRTGIPIALSVVYIEIARRIGQPVSGIGLPGHFIVEYNDGDFTTYIDPFHSGKLLSADDCRQLARARTGSDADATALAPVGTRYILVRMLNNLRSAYFRSKRFEKMVAVTDLLLEGFPENADYYKARGFARLRMRQFRGAQNDLEMYLKYAPDAEDRPQITQQLGAIHRWLGRMN